MKVVISQKIPEIGYEILSNAGYDIDYHDSNDKLTYDDLLDRCKDADALLCLLNDKVDRNFIRSCNKLKIIANHAVGYENIDIDAATSNGIWVTNTPDVLTNATADFAFTLLLATARRFIEGHNYIRQGKFDGWQTTLLLGSEISGKTLGIVGAGRIGAAMARRGLGFNMDVLYFNRSSKPGLDAFGCKQVDLEYLLQESDFVSLHLPGNEETKHIINREMLRLMKSDAYLVNTGRGILIDEEALVEVLNEGHLAGVGLDVYENEPDITSGLFELDNVLLQPHIGSATHHARNSMSRLSANAICDVLSGKPPRHPVNDLNKS